MKIKFETDKLKKVVDKLNQVAAGLPGEEDEQSPYLRVDVAPHDGDLRVRMQVSNKRMTQWLGCALPLSDCEADEEGSFCVPVATLAKLLGLCPSDHVTLSFENGSVIVREERVGGSVQSVGTIPAEAWLTIKRFDGQTQDLRVPRQVLVDVAAALSFAVIIDETRAPLTGIHLSFEAGKVRAQASNGFVAALWECEDPAIEAEHPVKMLLLPEVLKKLGNVFDKDVDVLDVMLEPTMVSFVAPMMRFRAALEVSMDSYPDLRKELSASDDFWVEVPWIEFHRAMALVHTVAPKAVCTFTFTRDGRFAISAEHGGNRSKHQVPVTDKYGLPFDDRVNSMAGCFDVLSATVAKKGDAVRVGVIRPENERLPDMLFVRSGGWETIFYRVIQQGV